MSQPNVVDSSAWLEYFADTPCARHFEAPLEDTENLIVPVISIYEVFKKVYREKDENVALQIVSQMQAGKVIDLDLSLALDAGHHRLPLADSIIYATAEKYSATLWTLDEHFKGLHGVRYFAKPKKRGRRI